MSCKKVCIGLTVAFFIGLAIGVGVTLAIYFLTKPEEPTTTTTTTTPTTTASSTIDSDVPGLAVVRLKDFKTSARVSGMTITPGSNPRLATVQSAAPQLVLYSVEGDHISDGVTTDAPSTDYWDLVAHGNDILVGNGFSYTGSLHVYDSDLKYQSKEVALDHAPRGMYMEGSTLWIASHFQQHKILKYTLDANHMKETAEVFAQNFTTVLMNQPNDVVANTDRVGVACWSSSNVHVFKKSDGKKLFTYQGSPVGKVSKLFFQPSAVVMDTSNRLYVGDYYNQRIVVLSDEGKLLGYLATKEDGLLRPQAMLLRGYDLYVSHHDSKQAMVSIFKLQWI